MTNSISCGFDHVWIDRMYNKQTNKQTGEFWFESRYGIQIILGSTTYLQALGPKEHHTL